MSEDKGDWVGGCLGLLGFIFIFTVAFRLVCIVSYRPIPCDTIWFGHFDDPVAAENDCRDAFSR